MCSLSLLCQIFVLHLTPVSYSFSACLCTCAHTAGLASGNTADSNPFHMATDAWHVHSQPGAGCGARATHGSPHLRQSAASRLEVVYSDGAHFWVKMQQHPSQLLTCTEVISRFCRGRHGSQYDSVNQHDSGAGRHTGTQNHSSGAAHSRSQQGKRSKARHAESRPRYPVDLFISHLIVRICLYLI